MTVATVITDGYGTFSNANFVIPDGYGDYAADGGDDGPPLGGKGDNPPAISKRGIFKPTGLEFRKYRESKKDATVTVDAIEPQAAKVIAEVAARQAKAAKQTEDDYQQFEELYRSLELENIAFEWAYFESMQRERERISAAMREAARKQQEEDMLIITISIAALS